MIVEVLFVMDIIVESLCSAICHHITVLDFESPLARGSAIGLAVLDFVLFKGFKRKNIKKVHLKFI